MLHNGLEEGGGKKKNITINQKWQWWLQQEVMVVLANKRVIGIMVGCLLSHVGFICNHYWCCSNSCLWINWQTSCWLELQIYFDALQQQLLSSYGFSGKPVADHLLK